MTRIKPTTTWDSYRYDTYGPLSNYLEEDILDVSGNEIYIEGFGLFQNIISTDWI